MENNYGKLNRICVREGMSVTIQKTVYLKQDLTKFHLTLEVDGKVYNAQVSAADLYHSKFLHHIPLGDMDEAELHKRICQEIQQFDTHDVSYQTDQNGLQQVNHMQMFVFSNGSICAGGFNPQIYSGLTGYYIPPEAVKDLGEMKGIIKNLFAQLNHNPKVFYPLLLLNISAITNSFFRGLGEPQFMKISLWLAGASGSGKTELAKAMGTYLFADDALNTEMVSATARRTYVLKHLSESSGGVFLFDDVKKEAVRERKNSVLIKIDDILRSIFNGRLTDVIDKQPSPPLIDACALITGEYMKTEESQNARLLYLNVDGFLKDEKNSETLRILQKNPLWLTSVCCDYMRWLLVKMEDDAFRLFLKNKLKGMRDGKTGYGDINNSQRLNENRRMVEMAYVLLEMYLREKGLTEDFIARCNRAAKISIESLGNNTFALLGGEQMIVQKAISEVVKKCTIRKARYQLNPQYKDGGCKYRQDYFMLQDDDDILLIDDYEESLAKKTQGQHDQYDGKQCAIIREEKLMNLLNASIKDVLSEYPVACIPAEEIINCLPRLLKGMQLIYKQRRSDGGWGRTAVKYPVCQVCDEPTGKENWDGPIIETRCVVEFRPVVQINIEHPSMEILMERVDDDPLLEKTLRDIDWMCNEQREEIEENQIYKIRKAFMSGKSLYKE